MMVLSWVSRRAKALVYGLASLGIVLMYISLPAGRTWLLPPFVCFVLAIIALVIDIAMGQLWRQE